jgi:hypothetical protein
LCAAALIFFTALLPATLDVSSGSTSSPSSLALSSISPDPDSDSSSEALFSDLPPPRLLKEDGFDYGNVRWRMTVEEVEKALQASGRKDIQESLQNYSEWYSGAGLGIHAVYSPEPGIEFQEVYLFEQKGGTETWTLCSMGFSARADAQRQIVRMLDATYAPLLPAQERVGRDIIKNQSLFNMSSHRELESGRFVFYKPEYIIRTVRTVGLFHLIEQSEKASRVGLMLISAEDNVLYPFMGYVKLSIQGTNVNLRDRPSMRGRVLAQADGDGHSYFPYVTVRQHMPIQGAQGTLRTNSISGFVVQAQPVHNREDNSTWYRLFFASSYCIMAYLWDGELHRTDKLQIFGYTVPYVHADFVVTTWLDCYEREQIEKFSKGRPPLYPTGSVVSNIPYVVHANNDDPIFTVKNPVTIRLQPQRDAGKRTIPAGTKIIYNGPQPRHATPPNSTYDGTDYYHKDMDDNLWWPMIGTDERVMGWMTKEERLRLFRSSP